MIDRDLLRTTYKGGIAVNFFRACTIAMTWFRLALFILSARAVSSLMLLRSPLSKSVLFLAFDLDSRYSDVPSLMGLRSKTLSTSSHLRPCAQPLIR